MKLSAGEWAIPGEPRRTDRLVLLGVLVLAVAVAAAAYLQFLPVARQFWTGTGHDRHAHYYIGLRLAADVREGDLLGALKDVLSGSGVWGPLHGVLLAGVLLIGGFDYHFAVLPSLAGFVGTAVFGFLAARRAAGRAGNLAGFAAAVFILASPAHRAFATDIMLESLGACLTLMVLYFYLAAARDGTRGAGRGLALALTALFFHKSNYYVLVAIALLAAEFLARRQLYVTAGRDLLGKIRAGWLRSQLRQPANYLLLALLVLTAAIFLRGPQPLVIGERSLRIYPPYNILTIAYAIWFVRWLLWWRRTGREWNRQLDPRLGQMVLWHAWPVLVSFLLPGHIKDFFGYLTRDHGQVAPHHPLLGGLPFYSECLRTDYHLGAASLLLVLALAGLAILTWRNRPPGALLVLGLVLLAGALTIYHPSHRSRFLHSWIAALWVLAGMGVGHLVSARWLLDRKRLAGVLAGGVAGCLALLHLPGAFERGHAPEAGPLLGRASMLDVTDSYLPALADSQRVTILSSVPLIRFLADWTFIERFGRRRLEPHWFGFGPPGAANRNNFAKWLETTRCDTLVFIDRLPGGHFDFSVPDYQVQEQLGEVLERQQLFRVVEAHELPRCGCRVRIWRPGGVSRGVFRKFVP
jgi:hypothetical protein